MHITNIHPTTTDHVELFVTADILGRPYRSSASTSKRNLGPAAGSSRFQTERNRLTAAMRRARIEHLTFPKDRDLQLAFQDAQAAETEFIRIHRDDIRQEIKAGFRDDAVQSPATLPSPPSLSALARDPSIQVTHPGTSEGFPFYRDCLIQLDEMVRKAAGDFVNRPGRQTEKSYKQAVNARSVFEMRHEAAIRMEQATATNAQTVQAETSEPSQPAFGNRVYELGVRTERQHGTGIPTAADRPGSPLAAFFDRNPETARDLAEMQDMRKWLSSHRGSGRLGEAGYATQSA